MHPSNLPENFTPYSSRNGVDVENDVRMLLADPEIELQVKEKDWIRAFSQGLFNGELGDLKCESEKNLEQIHATDLDPDVHEFYEGYFMTPDGKRELSTFGISEDASLDEVRANLLDIDAMNQWSAEDRRALATNSADWFKDNLAQQLAQSEETDQHFPEVDPLVVNYNPSRMLTKLERLQQYRAFYRKVRTYTAHGAHSNFGRAQQALLDIHISRVNNLVADTYANAVHFARQIDLTKESTAADAWALRLQEVAPIVTKLYHYESEARPAEIRDFSRRMDLIRNGADWQETSEGVESTPISREVRAFARQLEREELKTTEGREQKIPPEIVKMLDGVVWNAEQLQDLNEAVLREWGLNSEVVSSWQEVDERVGPAADGKWQVVVTPNKKSASVNGAKKVMFLPEKFKRSLTGESPAGALPLSGHELTHVWQNEFDDVLAADIPLAGIKGRRFITIREAGGMHQERVIQTEYFGRDRRTNISYLRALEAKLQGGTVAQAARAFLTSHSRGKQMEQGAHAAASALAADRVLRLYRFGGENSQPLDYVEQGLIVQELGAMSPQEANAFLIAAGSFMTRDSASLRKFGLFDVPKPEQITFDPARDVMAVFMRDFMPEIISQHAPF